MTKLQNLAKISNILKKNINTKTNYFMVLSMLMLTQTFFLIHWIDMYPKPIFKEALTHVKLDKF